MTVAELIEALRTLPQELPVYLGDWNEQYVPDSPLVDSEVRVEESKEVVSNQSQSFSRQRVLLFELPRRVVIGQSEH